MKIRHSPGFRLCFYLTIIALLLQLWVIVPAYGKAPVNDIMPVVVDSVHDGDTLTISLPCGVSFVCYKVPVRIVGIDTPELTDKRLDMRLIARQAKSRLMALTNKSHVVETIIIKRDKYFRLDGILFSDGVSVATILISEGLAKPYNGQGPKPW